MRLGVLVSHPIQYQAPVFRELSRQLRGELEVLFCHDHGTRPTFDAGFGKVIEFDVPLLEGYPHRFLKNRARRPGLRPGGLVNPEVVSLLRAGTHDALIVMGYASVTMQAALWVPRGRTRLLMRGDSNLLDPRPWHIRLTKEVLLRALFRRVDQFLAVGTNNVAYYHAYGVPADRITLSPFAVDNAYFMQRARAADRAATRRALGVPEGSVALLFCGKLQEKKRPLDALRAFAHLSAEPAATLLIAGDGAARPLLAQEAERLGVAARVKLLGFKNQSELPALYGAADVLVVPSASEPWGLVVNEALAAGAAVVASDHVGAAPDLVEPEAIFPAADPDALSRILQRLVREPGALEALKARGRERIARWGIAECVAGILEGARQALAR